jgi:hypothetical protein
MERGLANLDGTAFARFVMQIGIPGEYVLTGSYAGLTDAIIRSLAEREVREREVAAGRMAAVPGPPRRGRPRRKGMTSSVPDASILP